MSKPFGLAVILSMLVAVLLPLSVTRAADAIQGQDSDRDGNGLPDELELRLANQFAPIVFYDPDEPNLPTRVDQFLKMTQLWFFSKYCSQQQVLIGATDGSIPRNTVSSCRVPGETVDSYGTRSASKTSTFYLSNVSTEARRGSEDPQNWVTYVHSYPNEAGGVTLQYWRFYPFNTSYWFGVHLEGGDHGGDWEAIHVVLGPGPGYAPLEVRLLGHRDLSTVPWSRVIHEGTHPLIVCAKGSHTSELATPSQLAHRSGLVEQQSWTGGTVRWPGRAAPQPSGPLVLLGQKTRPMPGMEWIQYSGLWGTREKAGVLPVYRSGYWGPAFNETGIRSDGFFSAWCEGLARASKIPLREECFASGIVP